MVDSAQAKLHLLWFNRVLALVDEAKPACDEVRRRGLEIADAMRRLSEASDFDEQRSRVLMRMCADYAARAAAFADDQNRVLTDVMLAQDYQDLSGQVIGKVMKILFRVEDELKHVLQDGELPDPVAAMTGTTEALAGVQAWAGTGTYSASKHGIMALTRSLADEGRSFNIKVSAICPAGVADELVDASPDEIERSEKISPFDIAETAVYLARLGKHAVVHQIVVDRLGAEW